MKEIVKISSRIESFTPKEIAFAVCCHFLMFLAGISTTRAVVLDKLLPFGVSFLAAASPTFTPAVSIGVFFGYFFPIVGNSGFKYIAALFAVLSIKLLLGGYKKIATNPLFLSVIALLASFMTSAVNLRNGNLDFLSAATESILCFIGTYFLSKSFKLLYGVPQGLSAEEMTSLLISVSILLMGLNAFSVEGVSIGRILSATLILIVAKQGGILSGAIAGITTSLCITLSHTNTFSGIGFAFSGLMAGVFSPLGKYAQIVIVILFSFIGSVPTANVNLIAISVLEVSVGSLIYLFIPRKVNSYFTRLFSYKTKLNIPESFKKSLTLRLELASNALKDVSQTVEQVSSELSKINSPDFNKVIYNIEQDACLGCKLRVHCWESRKNSTLDAVIAMTNAVKQGEISPENAVGPEFKGRCLRLSKIGSATYKRYSDYASKIAAENRIDEVRSVVSDQFDGISSMLYDLSVDFKCDEQFDTTAAQTAVLALKDIGINIEEVCARVDKFDRMTLEFKLKRENELIINKMQIIRALSVSCERNFDIPIISELGKEIYITVCEKADIKIDFGVHQICSEKSSMCGDAYKEFYDGKGHFLMVLSDGMGTGGRAAVDGAMASGLMSRLIKSGFGYNCSLKILNSSMLFKSTDESLATLDIASIDLYTGLLEIYKAGAAPTVIRRQGKAMKAESTSLPAGILRDISFDKAHIKLRCGDIVVMMSDGVTQNGNEWIKAEIEAFREGNAQSLATHLCECAKRRNESQNCDDLSVLVAILEKAN